MIDKLLYCTSGCLTYSGILLAIIQEYYLHLTVAEKGKSVFFSGVALDILNTHQRRLYTQTKHTPGFFFLCLVWFDVYVCALFVLEENIGNVVGVNLEEVGGGERVCPKYIA